METMRCSEQAAHVEEMVDEYRTILRRKAECEMIRAII
jgi:hypothetical protein